MPTNQEVFNKAYIGLREQGFRKSVTVYGDRCVYRSDNGNKCAIGHCIPDDMYTPSMEGAEPARLIKDFADIARYIGEDLDFLEALQMAHDSAAKPADMQAYLREVAQGCKLTVPE